MNKKKFYVVIEGFAPGIYDTWEECRAQVEGYPRAKFKGYASLEDAIEAFREASDGDTGIYRAMAAKSPAPASLPEDGQVVFNYEAFPEITMDAIAVDGACAGVPGPMEYRGVSLETGRELFRKGPFPDATNNIGEYLAIVHALAMLKQQGNSHTTIYSDSVTAISWVRKGGNRSMVQPTEANAPLRAIMARADAWLQANRPENPIVKWDTRRWGEIPADFGRK